MSIASSAHNNAATVVVDDDDDAPPPPDDDDGVVASTPAAPVFVDDPQRDAADAALFADMSSVYDRDDAIVESFVVFVWTVALLFL